MPLIRTTITPGIEQEVSDDEYEILLDAGLIYDGSPPVEPLDDVFDRRMADRTVDPSTEFRTAADAVYVRKTNLHISGTPPVAPAVGTVWINNGV